MKRIIKTSFTVVVFCFLIVILTCSVIYLHKIHNINKERYKPYSTEKLVTLRKFPYPYLAAIAISSDIDNTKTLEEFLEIQKFLNTNDMTSMGRGIGLEIGNSFFFYEPPDQAISYFESEPLVRQTIIKFIEAGYIDVMHSYGKSKHFNRNDAIRGLKELSNKNLKVEVWIDHTRSIDNLGNYRTFGKGDHSESTAYHADLTIAYGIKFVWLGRVTMAIGQSVPVSYKTFTGIFDSEHILHSFMNITKEFAKNFLGVFGNEKYSLHKANDLVKITLLDDGQRVWEFIRFDNHWNGVGKGADSKGLAYSISERNLTRLKNFEGYMIVYTHFGKNSECSQYICKEAQVTLRNLANEHKLGNIFVTTTSKLLKYYIVHRYLDWSYDAASGKVNIIISKVEDPIFGAFYPKLSQLAGITFYVPDKDRASIFINEDEINDIQKNNSDDTGRESITIPLRFLKYPLN